MKATSPLVSAVLVCRNEKNHIEICVRSILAQQPPPGDFEIIVADGMSEDGTAETLRYLSQENTRLRVVDNPSRTTPCGMNIGIREAQGHYIAIMGAHSRYAHDYLCQSVKVLEETQADNVGGAMICEARSWIQSAIAAAHHSSFSVGGAQWHDPDYEGPTDTVFGGVYRREVFDQIGLFDEELVRNQDDEFNLRLIRASGRIWQSPRIRSWYRPRGSLGTLFRQYKQYGYWRVRVIQKHGTPASLRQLVPGGFVLLLTVLALGSLWWPSVFWAWLALMGTYFLCNIAASFLTASRWEWKLFPTLLIVFPCYHFGYGYGFLRGLWDFVVFQRKPAHNYTELTRLSAGNSRSDTTASR